MYPVQDLIRMGLLVVVADESHSVKSRLTDMTFDLEAVKCVSDFAESQLRNVRQTRDATPWTHKREPWQAHQSKRKKRR